MEQQPTIDEITIQLLKNALDEANALLSERATAIWLLEQKVEKLQLQLASNTGEIDNE